MSGSGGSSNGILTKILRRSVVKFTDRLLAGAVRLGLAPHVRIPAPAKTHDPEELVANTDSLNVAAETYFSAYEHSEFILTKPYSDPHRFPQHLFNMGVLFHWLRISPGDVVLEIGAGTAWVSHFLNLFGCRTIALDVSGTALEMAEELFKRDRRTQWNLEPKFLTYDGHRFPLEDGSCDRIIIHDAFHHIPNQEEILGEMARVLNPWGVVAMVEPGRRHSLTSDSRKEMEETGVLENDIVLEDLAKLARRCGFSKTTTVPVNLNATMEVPAEDLVGFLKGKEIRTFWTKLTQQLLNEHYILMYRRGVMPTTRKPGLLRAEIEILEPSPGATTIAAKVGEPTRLLCRVTNRGDTAWLPESTGRPGCTSIAGHLHRGAEVTDWLRSPLLEPMEPGDEVVQELLLPAIFEPGPARVVLDMVAEDVTWFAQQGSSSLEIVLEVA